SICFTGYRSDRTGGNTRPVTTASARHRAVRQIPPNDSLLNQPMRAKIKSRFLPHTLIAALVSTAVGRAPAQTFTTVHSFAPTVLIDNGNFTFSFTNRDGAFPAAGLIADATGNLLYGTAFQGGGSYIGTVFAVNKDGAGFSVLHSF